MYLVFYYSNAIGGYGDLLILIQSAYTSLEGFLTHRHLGIDGFCICLIIERQEAAGLVKLKHDGSRMLIQLGFYTLLQDKVYLVIAAYLLDEALQPLTKT